jgi:high-affinity iron transporter
MLPSFLIFLREGLEGSMIVAILLAYLAAGGRRELFGWVYGGTLAALVASAAIGGLLFWVARTAFVGSAAQTWYETGTFALAVIVLTYMTFWMKRHSRSIGRELRSKADSAIHQGSGLALAAAAFVTVGREAVETAIFVVAITFQNTAPRLIGGAALGMALALATSYGIFRLGLHLNIGRVFTVIGAGLMVVAAGLLADVVQNLQELRVLPGAGNALWNTNGLIPQDGTAGDILHGLLGYAATPTALQLLAWTCFLGLGLALYLRRPRSVSGAVS